MGNIFLTSDQHFGHANILNFTDRDGNKIRPHWNNVEDMDNDLVERYNAVVKPGDKVYFLGDIAMKRAYISTVGRLNGDKVLIKGNHDVAELREYTKYFRDIRACHVLNNMIMTHIPIHLDGKVRYIVNIHGHLHNNVMKEDGRQWYINVSVEQTNFTPIAFDDIEQRVKNIFGINSIKEIYTKIREESKLQENNF
jgi:hypothetical protein